MLQQYHHSNSSNDDYSSFNDSFKDAQSIYTIFGIVASVLYSVIVISFLYRPRILATQHPAAPLVVWQMLCGLFLSLGLVISSRVTTMKECQYLGTYNHFFIIGSVAWYLVLSIDLLIALVNPWIQTRTKTWWYHLFCWTAAAASSAFLYGINGAGVSALNLCWIRATPAADAINENTWTLLFIPIAIVFSITVLVLGFATYRFARRQHDLTHRSKRRHLLQYLRYLVAFGIYWSGSATIYYLDYLNEFQGSYWTILFASMYALYPILLLLAWCANTDYFICTSDVSRLYDATPDNNSNHQQQDEASWRLEQVSAVIRKDMMRYTTSGIIQGIRDENLPSPVVSKNIYAEKKRLSTNVLFSTTSDDGIHRYYEKLGFSDYAPKVFSQIRALCRIDRESYMESFASSQELTESSSEGKSGMLFYFSKDRRYLVKTMTKQEHEFLLDILPSYHQYLQRNPRSLLCRYVGCHSMQLPFGWNRMFFVVMENVLWSSQFTERYDLKGTLSYNVNTASESNTTELTPFMRDCDGSSSSSASSLLYDVDFVHRKRTLAIDSETRVDLLKQMTSDCNFLQGQQIMDYSLLLGICRSGRQKHNVSQLPRNAVISKDKKEVYYLGFIDVLQHYTFGWKLQHWVLSCILDRKKITALPPAEYALRFLSFAHNHILRDESTGSAGYRQKRLSYGSLGFTSSIEVLNEEKQPRRSGR